MSNSVVENADIGLAAPARVERVVLLAILLTPMLVLKFWLSRGLGVETDDANYYYQIARHVAEGDGLVTSVSLHHQGLRHLPAPATIYPLWPWLLGIVGKVSSLPWAAATLPPLFYFLTLIGVYVFTNRIAGPDESPSRLAALTPGHLAVLMFGLNPIFFRYSSAPYTEALAFFLTVAALLCFHRAVRRDRLAWSAVAGVIAALAYLSRYQMMMLIAAIAVAYFLAPWNRKRATTHALVFSAAPVVAGLAWLFYRGWTTHHLSLANLWDFYYREIPGLPSGPYVVPLNGWAAVLRDRIGGVGVALSLSDPRSYFSSFGVVVFLVPLAILALFLRGGNPRDREGGATILASVLAGLFLLAPVHYAHTAHFGDWLFGTRHGLSLIFLLLPALTILLARPEKYLRWMAIALVVISAAFGMQGILRLGTSGWPRPGGPGFEGLAAWLDQRPPTPAVLSTNAQYLATVSKANFYWMGCYEPASETVLAARLQPIDFVAVLPQDGDCPCFAGLPPEFRPVREFGTGKNRVVLLQVPR
jgi:4-amino-4-deoxy-L-arabinose transferase-like glycosyltransferase